MTTTFEHERIARSPTVLASCRDAQNNVASDAFKMVAENFSLTHSVSQLAVLERGLDINIRK